MPNTNLELKVFDEKLNKLLPRKILRKEVYVCIICLKLYIAYHDSNKYQAFQ